MRKSQVSPTSTTSGLANTITKNRREGGTRSGSILGVDHIIGDYIFVSDFGNLCLPYPSIGKLFILPNQTYFRSGIVWSFLLWVIVQNLAVVKKSVNPYNLFVKQQAIQYLNSQAQDKPIKVYLNTELGLQFGFDYLMDFYRIKRTNAEGEETYQLVLREEDKGDGVTFRASGAPAGIRVVKIN